jgi:hypothetical protein
MPTLLVLLGGVLGPVSQASELGLAEPLECEPSQEVLTSNE